MRTPEFGHAVGHHRIEIMTLRAIKMLFVMGIAVLATNSALAQQNPERQGEAILTRNCSMCHATGRAGTSPHREAPAFRTLSQRYPVDELQEALGEGLSSGHPDMPDFVFPPDQIGAILAYLRSIQAR